MRTIVDAWARRRSVRLTVLVVSLVSAASIGGGFLLGVVLVPALVFAARHVSRAAAVAYGLVAAVLTAEVSWAVMFLVVGDEHPLTWLVPAVAAAAALVVAVGSARPAATPPAS